MAADRVEPDELVDGAVGVDHEVRAGAGKLVQLGVGHVGGERGVGGRERRARCVVLDDHPGPAELPRVDPVVALRVGGRLGPPRRRERDGPLDDVRPRRVNGRPVPAARRIAVPEDRMLAAGRLREAPLGIDAWKLRRPRAIVEHYTAGTTFASAYATFAADVPDSELHELPGTCAHFVIDTDGTIYQLVRLDTICRHTVGLNYTAIGIEHVGTSDGEILGNAAQLDASLRLTAWLQWRYGIKLRNVIGHESLTSPFTTYASSRCQTHGDWTAADMDTYPRALRTQPPLAWRVRAPARPVSSGC